MFTPLLLFASLYGMDQQALAAHVPVPPAAPRGVERDASLMVGFGGGWLALSDSLGREGQAAWTLRARVALGLAVDWMVFMGAEVGGTTRYDSTFIQTTLMAGVQRFLGGRFYVYAGLGPSWVAEKASNYSDSVGPGLGGTIGVGIEALRLPHAAIGIEASSTLGVFARERWDTGGVNLTFAGH